MKQTICTIVGLLLTLALSNNMTWATSTKSVTDADEAVTVAKKIISQKAQTSDTELFINQLYSTFLFREPDEAGKNYWINRIETGEESPVEVTYEFTRSEEFNERISSVSRLYFFLFGRVPDSKGMHHWLDKIDQGMSINLDLVNSFMASQEYYNKYGTAQCNTQFLEQILQKGGLNREATAGDFDAWSNFLAAGQRAPIIAAYAHSYEFNLLHGLKILQTSLYYGILDRAPTTEELSTAVADPVELISDLYQNPSYSGEPLPKFIPLPVIGATETEMVVDEDCGTVVITINRTVSADLVSSVDYHTDMIWGDKEGVDYTGGKGTVTFAPEETQKQIELHIIDDDIKEVDEYFRLTLSSVTGAKLGERSSSISIVIVDNDSLKPVIIPSQGPDNGVAITGVEAGDFLGRTVCAAGDMNGDGFADFIIGSDVNNASSYLIFGRSDLSINPPDLASLKVSLGVLIHGVAPRNSRAGDINGDGYDDLILGNPVANGHGEAYLVFGHGGNWDSTFSLNAMDATNGVLISGITTGDETGSAVGAAGDINGDGIDDLVIGSPGSLWNTKASRSHGQAHVIYGHTGDWAANFDLENLDLDKGTAIVGNLDRPYHFGHTVNGVGDMNGDGIDDLIIMENGFRGKFGYGLGVYGYLLFGNPLGWGSSIYIDQITEDESVRIKVMGGLGYNPVKAASDINGDGFSDMIIGTSTYNGGQGSGTVVLGHDGPWPTTLSNDDYDGNNGFNINNLKRNLGHDVAGIGDINNDGYDDFLIGQGGNVGEVYVLMGSPDGWTSNLNLYMLEPDEGQILKGASEGDSFGGSLTGLGDVNGDGFDDFLIGAPGVDLAGYNDVGQAYLFFGSNSF
ncbi:MAG: DUF4214 domain-containing protein [Desulfobacteraceae bacterium]|nr:DUF4214 domain-containing protein [Desulfobacteraceae bacterium]